MVYYFKTKNMSYSEEINDCCRLSICISPGSLCYTSLPHDCHCLKGCPVSRKQFLVKYYHQIPRTFNKKAITTVNCLLHTYLG